MKLGSYVAMIKIVGMLLIGYVIFITIISLLFSYNIVHPSRRQSTLTPSYYEMDYENIVFNSLDGLQLEGWLILNNEYQSQSRPLVIVCHGHGSSKWDVLAVAEMLHSNGYNTLLFDFRVHGDSEGDLATLGWLEVNDLKGAIEYVKESLKEKVDLDKIGVIGFSMGGATAITTAGQIGDIKAVVADSAFADRSKLINQFVKRSLPFPLGSLTSLFVQMHGVDVHENLPVNFAEKISPNALLIIQGDEDHLVDVEDAQLLYDNTREPKELWLVTDAPHVGAYYTEKDEYEERVLGFFDRYLKS